MSPKLWIEDRYLVCEITKSSYYKIIEQLNKSMSTIDYVVKKDPSNSPKYHYCQEWSTGMSGIADTTTYLVTIDGKEPKPNDLAFMLRKTANTTSEVSEFYILIPK